MFTAALFTTAKTWKQLNVHRQMNELRRCGTYIQMEYYSAIKRQNNAICSNTFGTRDSHIKGRKSERER